MLERNTLSTFGGFIVSAVQWDDEGHFEVPEQRMEKRNQENELKNKISFWIYGILIVDQGMKWFNHVTRNNSEKE